MKLTEDYIAQLQVAMRSDVARRFIRTRLTESLLLINIDPVCIAAIHSVLEFLAYRQRITPESLAVVGEKFQKAWRVHLNRTYFIEYETLRWPYLRDYVLKDIDPNIRLGRCLDTGCGRGWLTSQLVISRLADSAMGIDAAGYESEWKERLAQFKGPGLDFVRVPVGDFGDWTQRQAKFDTILMLYVLHHSTEYWAVTTLQMLQQVMSPVSKLIIVEDSCSTNAPAKHDRDNINGLWASIASSSQIYALTDAFHIQIVLDFVAVQLLANFGDVDMPCTYKKVDEWEHLFDRLGFSVQKAVYLGFPKERDIDVPQSYFVLKLK